MTRAITATLAIASSMVQLRRAPKDSAGMGRTVPGGIAGLLLKGNFGLGGSTIGGSGGSFWQWARVKST